MSFENIRNEKFEVELSNEDSQSIKGGLPPYASTKIYLGDTWNPVGGDDGQGGSEARYTTRIDYNVNKHDVARGEVRTAG